MTKINLKSIMYILISILAIVVFFKILPFLVFGGIIAYVVLKIVRYLKDKTAGVRFENNSGFTSNNDGKVHMEDEVSTSQAIDVDYKDV